MKKILKLILAAFTVIACNAMQTDNLNKEILQDVNGMLLHAVWHDKPKRVKEALSWGANIEALNRPHRSGATPLIIASWRKFEVFKILLDAKANVNAVDYHQQAPLDMAIGKRNGVKTVTALLEAHATIELPQIPNRRLLHHNITVNTNLDIVKILLDHNADYNEENISKETAIQHAYKKSIIYPESAIYPKIIALISDHSAQLIKEFQALAQSCKYPEKISQLIAHLAFGLEDKKNLDYNKMLTDAFKWSYPTLNEVKAALEHGACIDFIQPDDFYNNNDLNSPLMLAINNCTASKPEVVDYLIKACADVNYQNRLGYTALQNAVMRGNKEIVKKIIDAKALINVANRNPNDTALSLSLPQGSWRSGNKEILELLLAHGAEYEQFLEYNYRDQEKLFSEILLPLAPDYITAATGFMPPLAKLIAKLAFGFDQIA